MHATKDVDADADAVVGLSDARPVSIVSEADADGPLNDIRLQKLYSKISSRMLPLLMIVVILNHIGNADRTNLAFAALTFNRDLGFDAVTYGLGSSLFFVTFCVFQVPSNLVMVRVGVSRWLSFLIFSWGIVASCFSLIRNKAGFFTLRLLLGAFEAGTLPACWYLVSQFFPKERLTKPHTYLTVAILLAQILGGPLAAGFLAMNGLGGLHGWQWLFMLEGVPSVTMGFVLWFTLPDKPSEARWLSPSEQALLAEDMADSIKDSPPAEHVPRSPLKLFRILAKSPLLPFFCLVGIMLSMASHTYIFWLPIIISALLRGTALTQTSVAAKAPAGGAHGGVARRKELWWHVIVCLGSAGVAFYLFPVMARFSVAAAFICLVLIGMFGAAANGPKTVLAARLCAGPAQVLGMPLYNSVSVIGGIIGPYLTGAVVAKYGGFLVVSIIMGSMLCAGSILVMFLKYPYQARCRRLGQSDWEGELPPLPVKRNRSDAAPSMETSVVEPSPPGTVSSSRARTSAQDQQL
eukprot:gene8854-9033_t